MFSSSFGEEALLLGGFFLDIDWRNHEINPSRLKKIDLYIPIFIVHYGRRDRQTEGQLKRRETYRILRILSVTRNAPRAGTERIDRKLAIWFVGCPFYQTRLLLVITVHDILSLICSAMHYNCTFPARSRTGCSYT